MWLEVQGVGYRSRCRGTEVNTHVNILVNTHLQLESLGLSSTLKIRPTAFFSSPKNKTVSNVQGKWYKGFLQPLRLDQAVNFAVQGRHIYVLGVQLSSSSIFLLLASLLYFSNSKDTHTTSYVRMVKIRTQASYLYACVFIGDGVSYSHSGPGNVGHW